MSKVEIKIELKIKFYNMFFFGGGSGAGNMHSYLLRDMEGFPYISGAALKGCISDYVSALGDFYPQLTRSGKALFGTGGLRAGRLYFSNGELEDKDTYRHMQGLYTLFKTGIAMNNYTHSKKEGGLYTVEAGGQTGTMVFASTISGFLDSDDYKELLALLISAIRMIFALGGKRSSGFGWLASPVDCAVYIDHVKLPSEEINQWIGGALCI